MLSNRMINYSDAEQESFGSLSDNNTKKCSDQLYKVAYFIPFVNGLTDAAQALLGETKMSRPFAYTVAICTGLSTFSLTKDFTLSNIEEAHTILKNKVLPADWPRINSRKKENLIITMAALITVYVAFSDAVQVRFFSDTVPSQCGFEDEVSPHLWNYISLSLASLTGLGSILAKGLETYKSLREIASGESIQYTTRLGRYSIPLLSSVFGSAGVINEMLNNTSSYKDIFRVNNYKGIAIILSLSTLNGFAEFSLNGRNIRDQLNTFMEYTLKNLPKEQVSEKIKNILSFFIAASAAGLLASSSYGLAELLLTNLLPEFKIFSYLKSPLIKAVSIGIGGYNVLTNTCNLYPISKCFVNGVPTAVKSLYEFTKKKICTKQQEDEVTLLSDIETAIPEEDKEIDLTEKHPYDRLFGQAYNFFATPKFEKIINQGRNSKVMTV